jgi:crotonobetainyl-CoA:carnitine CoA-transferase CaiB-like acyl-CoA transferase
MYASIAVCAALAHRAATGKGQWIDVALFDSCAAFLANQAMNYFATGASPGRLGNAHPNIVPYQTFATKDGNIILACGNDNLFNKFCEVAECMHFARDARFSTNAGRVNHRDEITRLLADVFARRTTHEWVELLDAAGVANGPINSIEQVFREPQAAARGLKIELEHAAAGKVALVANPMRFSETPIDYTLAPPVLGQHTDEILRDTLGMSEAEIGKLRAAGVV